MDLRAVSPFPCEFAAFTASPAERIWMALTDPELTPTYLYGLSLRSNWTAGAPIEACFAGRVELTGQVLCARPRERLSYSLLSAPGDPSAYLTWLIRPSVGGTVLTLRIDDADGPDRRGDAEDVWLPVLAALQRSLDAAW